MRCSYRIDLACSNDETRYALNHPNLDGDKIIGTDGRILLAVPVQRDPGDIDGPIPKEVIQPIVRTAEKLNPIKVKMSKRFVLLENKGEKTTIYPRPECRFPNWELVVPKENPEYEIAINPRLLMKLANAIGLEKGEGLKLIFRGADKAIEVKAKYHPDILAYVMPVVLW